MSDATQNNLGSVVSLWRYPVESMMGEQLNATDVTQRGLLGDRAYVLVDSSTEKVASAKNPENGRSSTTFGLLSPNLSVPVRSFLRFTSHSRTAP
jgi:hypothetical protein